ncbi:MULTISPECIES: Maf family nucleotide pyrophosphatase [Weeksella]|uniref:Maf family nucleotide pyrophosphatase n=1 Tax=Weeksella TaxID=1013 RepID=UPI0008A392A6|nr:MULTISPECIES: Maf family protein [Weeksella]MDK7374407.1 Maf family protein [Weeksella virosa]OFM81797.1 septum formation inhibitor Maf [Weeksella sp. HMSC059D05]
MSHPIDTKSFNLILGSQSPRRKALLQEMGFSFSCISLDIDEQFDREKYKAAEITDHLARKKANAYPDLQARDILITSDTTVWVNNQSLEKASSEKEAIEMIRSLSNQKHSVYTSVCIKSIHQEITFSDETKVYFRTITDEEITYYVQNYRPYDKAGAYGIQEWIGLIGIEKIEGNYFTVMGLPTTLLYHELKQFVEQESLYYNT